MGRRLQLRDELEGIHKPMMRHLVFDLAEDGTVEVIEGEAVVQRFQNLARALTTYRIRRTDLVPAPI